MTWPYPVEASLWQAAPWLRNGPGDGSGGQPEVERSITIGKTPDELRRRWLDPRTLPRIMAADGALRRFKSLVETGEIPTTERQPAARADTR